MMDATVTNGQLATHLSDLLKDEKVDTNVVETTTNDDLNALFDEVTSLEQRAKEKASNATALQLSKNESTNVSNGQQLLTKTVVFCIISILFLSSCIF